MKTQFEIFYCLWEFILTGIVNDKGLHWSNYSMMLWMLNGAWWMVIEKSHTPEIINPICKPMTNKS
ncbi:hypothetical protein ACHAXS_007331 [Conticribra weissflogii]